MFFFHHFHHHHQPSIIHHNHFHLVFFSISPEPPPPPSRDHHHHHPVSLSPPSSPFVSPPFLHHPSDGSRSSLPLNLFHPFLRHGPCRRERKGGREGEEGEEGEGGKKLHLRTKLYHSGAFYFMYFFVLFPSSRSK